MTRRRRPRPLVVPVGAEVLLEMRHGAIAHTGLFHLPTVPADREGRVFSPDPAARALCGLPGETYALGGELLDLRLCSVCEARAPASMGVKPKREAAA